PFALIFRKSFNSGKRLCLEKFWALAGSAIVNNSFIVIESSHSTDCLLPQPARLMKLSISVTKSFWQFFANDSLFSACPFLRSASSISFEHGDFGSPCQDILEFDQLISIKQAPMPRDLPIPSE